MHLNPFPIIIHPSAAVRRLAGPEINKIAGLALRSVLKNGRSIEIAHQQFTYRSQPIALSSRIGHQGDLIIEMDIGDPALADRIILEVDLKSAVHSNVSSRKAGDKGRTGR